MNIIFNELEYAEQLLHDGFTDYLVWHDLKILSKYFRYKNLNNPQIKKSIIEFYTKFSNYNESIVGNKLDNAIKKSEKYPLRISTSVVITESEITAIRALKNYKFEKICFVMLTISRSNRKAFNSKSSRYYLNVNFSEILKIAKVHANKKERNKIKHDLFKLGMICAPNPNKKSEYNRHGEMFELLFIGEESPDGIIVTDMNRIVSFYPQKCIECGEEMSSQTKRLKEICDKCYEKQRIQVKKESAQKIYQKSKKI